MLALLCAAAPGIAQAQVKLEASYAISVARIPIGNVTASAEFGDVQYTMSMSGRAERRAAHPRKRRRFAHRPMASSPTARRSRPPSSPAPPPTTTPSTSSSSWTAATSRNCPPRSHSPIPDRVALTEAAPPRHRRSADARCSSRPPATATALTEAACQRTLSIFDGRRRFDLKLAFKRMDKVKAEKRLCRAGRGLRGDLPAGRRPSHARAP